MNVVPILPTIGSGQSSTLVEFVHIYQRPWETELPGLGPRLPLESQTGRPLWPNRLRTPRANSVKSLKPSAVSSPPTPAPTSSIVEPTDHCVDKRVTWPVHRRPVAAGNQATLSASLGEAPLHTGSAFLYHPECTR